MRHAVFTVSMPRSTPEEAIARIRDAGGHGVEWRLVRDVGDTAKPGFWSGNRCTLQPDWDDERYARIAEATRVAGLAVPNLGAYVQAADPAEVERLMRIARILGAPSLRVGFGGYDGATPYWKALEAARAQLARVVEAAQRTGIKVLVEMHHGTLVPSASLAWNLVNGFPAERVGVIYDAGNLVHEGFENHQLGMELLGPYLAHVHIKNAAPAPKPLSGPQPLLFEAGWAPLRAGAVNFPRLFAAMRAVGYDGWLSLEDFSIGMDEPAALRDAFAFLDALAAQSAAAR